MNCDEYKKLYESYMDLPLSKDVWDTELYSEWIEHTTDCKECDEWDIFQRLKERDVKVEDYPCVHITYHVTEPCEKHNHDPWECPDIIMVKTSSGYGIPIKDGGSSFLRIEYCPWCGIRLK